MMKSTPKKLYHYCSIETLLKIIESKSLWLSNCSQMNDAKESVWVEQYFDLINESLWSGDFDDFKESLFLHYNWNKNHPYIFCLSEVDDSLGQWRAYSSDGKGVAIGFNTKMLGLKNELPAPNVYKDNTIGLVKVEYDVRKQKSQIQNLTDNFGDTHLNRKEDWELVPVYFSKLLIDHSLIFKNPSFSEEKEWRIIHTPVSSGYEKDNSKIELSEKKFRANGFRLTSYFELNLEKVFNSKLIPEIILGPKSEVDSQILRELLDQNNLNNTLVKSSISTYK